jgi:hypothetical protein
MRFLRGPRQRRLLSPPVHTPACTSAAANLQRARDGLRRAHREAGGGMVRTPEIQGLLLEAKKKAAPSSPEVLDPTVLRGDARSWPGG